MPCFSLPGVAARALSAMVHYNNILAREAGEVKTFSDVDSAAAAAIMDKAVASGRKLLAAEDVYGILDAYKIPTAGWAVVSTPEEAEKAAADIGYPVVVKADSESIVHKSDMGGVAVNLGDGEAVKAAVADMQSKFQADDLKFLVQKFTPGGTEVIIGAKAEEGLGHLIMFGMGGIYVEVLKDVVFNLTPLTTAEAAEMLSEIRLAPLLEGIRGQQGVDREGLQEVLLRLSQLLADLPQIQELDLNPTLAFTDRVCAVDARMSL